MEVQDQGSMWKFEKHILASSLDFQRVSVLCVNVDQKEHQ